MRALCIWAPIAGGGRATERLRAAARGLDLELAAAEAPGQAEALAAAANGVEAVIAAGGDGTVHEVAGGLMRRPAGPLPMGILPLGTGNDVARNLDLDSVERSLAAMAVGATRAVDLIALDLVVDGRTQRRYGLLNTGIGFSAEVIRATTTRVKRLFGRRWAYTVGVFRALVPWRSPTFRLRHDAGEFEGRLLWLGVGNGEYEAGGTLRVSPGARMDDGRLELLVVRHGPKFELVRNFARIGTGEHIHHPLCDYRPVTWLEVECLDGRFDGQVEVQCDGDIIGRTPLRLAVVPAALRVYAPEPGP